MGAGFVHTSAEQAGAQERLSARSEGNPSNLFKGVRRCGRHNHLLQFRHRTKWNIDGGTITADEIVEALLDESEQYVRESLSLAEKPAVAISIDERWLGEGKFL